MKKNLKRIKEKERREGEVRSFKEREKEIIIE